MSCREKRFGRACCVFLCAAVLAGCSNEAAWTDAAGGKEETAASAVQETSESSEGETVIPSTYETVDGSWQEVYVAMTYPYLVLPEDGYEGVTVYSLIRFEAEEAPVLLIGTMVDMGRMYGHFHLYGFEENGESGRVYELYEFTGVPSWCPGENLFGISEDEDSAPEVYRYEHQNLIDLGDRDMSSKTDLEVPVYSEDEASSDLFLLVYSPVTSENIEQFVRGGADE